MALNCFEPDWSISAIDESERRVGAHQLDPYRVADVEAFEAADDATFDGRMRNAHPGAFRRCAGYDGVELRADSVLEQQRLRRLLDLALDLRCVVLLLRGDRTGRRSEPSEIATDRRTPSTPSPDPPPAARAASRARLGLATPPTDGKLGSLAHLTDA